MTLKPPSSASPSTRLECVEIIRGASPDIKTSGKTSLLNIILKKGEKKGSGTWKLDGEIVKGDAAAGGLLSYSGAVGKLDYQVSAQRVDQRRTFMLTEQQFTGTDMLDQIKRERDGIRNARDKFTANLTYQLNDGHRIALNGLYLDWDVETRAPGTLFDPIGVMTGVSERFTVEDQAEWEVGGDYEGGAFRQHYVQAVGPIHRYGLGNAVRRRPCGHRRCAGR